LLKFPKLSKTTTEKSAKTVNDAILAAIEELGVTKDDVTVDIIEEGKSGLFGLFSKDAVVRVTVKESVIAAAKEAERQAEQKPAKAEKQFTPTPAKQEKPEKQFSATQVKGERIAPRREEKVDVKPVASEKQEAPKPVKQNKLPPERRSTPKPAVEKQEPEAVKIPELTPEKKAEAAKVFATPEVRHPKKDRPSRPERPERKPRAERPHAEPKPHTEPKPPTPKKISGIPPQEIAEKFLTDIFRAMQLDISVSAHMESDDTLLINLDGENMGIVIGKRGDTLDSIQYLTSLVINQQTEGYIKVTIDTENYREKRSEALLALSSRLAEKVTRTGKKFTLEPMNPYERRIIHSNLQDSETVTTFSIGTEPYRKVVIAPKNVRPYSKKGGFKKGKRPYKPSPRRREPFNNGETHSEPMAEKKGSYTTTYKADFKPQQHKAEFKSFDDYLEAHKED
jgi:spoIIIJ-associated protein